MLYYKRIDISEEIDPTKSNKSKECMFRRYWFFNHGFKSQDSVCNCCHDLTLLSFNIRNIAIITLKLLIIALLFTTLANMKQLIY